MKIRYLKAVDIAVDFIDMFTIGKTQIAGSLRRHEPMIGDVDIITNDALYEVAKRCEEKRAKYKVKKVRGGDSKLDVDYRGMRFNIYHAEKDQWGAMQFFLTGPSGYGIAYRKRAKERGWKLNQYGLFDEKGNNIASKTEHDIYEALGKAYKPPELRGK